MMSLIIVFLTITLTERACATKLLPLKTFEAVEAPLQNVLHISLPGHRGVVVLAGRNALYKLSAEDLSLQAYWRSGPEYDSLLCPPYPLYCDQKRQGTANDNQVLLQISTDPLVLACGTTSQGMCTIHQLLRDLEPNEQMGKNLIENYVAARTGTTAFFGSIEKNDVMFVASLYDGQPSKYHPYVIAARVVSATGSFSVRSSIPAVGFFDNGTETLSYINFTRYVYGFNHNGFAYFLTVQTSATPSNTIETRLVRVWEREPPFLTYADLPIRCPEKNSGLRSKATVAISASLEHSPPDSKTRSKVLAVAFTASVSGRPDLIDESLGSYLCFFDMHHVETAFNKAAETNGICWPKTDISHCSHFDQLGCEAPNNKGDVCPSTPRHFRTDQVSLTGKATMHFRQELATSVTVMRQSGAIVSWVGDNEGYLHKVLLRDQSSKLLSWTDISNGKSIPIGKSTALDSRGAYGYFLLDNKVLKFPVGSCGIYQSCSKCLQSRDDPLQCGWCEGRCAHRAECPPNAEMVFDRCPVDVDAVSPSHGPTSGNTMLTILGDNFGYWWREPSNTIEVTVGGKNCQVVVWVSSLVKCKTPPSEHAAKVDIVISVNDTVRDDDKNYDVVDTLTLRQRFVYKVVTRNPPTEGDTNVFLIITAVLKGLFSSCVLLISVGTVLTAAIAMGWIASERAWKRLSISRYQVAEMKTLDEQKTDAATTSLNTTKLPNENVAILPGTIIKKGISSCKFEWTQLLREIRLMIVQTDHKNAFLGTELIVLYAEEFFNRTDKILMSSKTAPIEMLHAEITSSRPAEMTQLLHRLRLTVERKLTALEGTKDTNAFMETEELIEDGKVLVERIDEVCVNVSRAEDVVENISKIDS